MNTNLSVQPAVTVRFHLKLSELISEKRNARGTAVLKPLQIYQFRMALNVSKLGELSEMKLTSLENIYIFFMHLQ